MQSEYITPVRNDEGLIDGYLVDYPADKQRKQGPIKIFLTRDDVEYLYQTYPRAGMNLTIPEINRNFPKLSYYALGKILALFEINKNSYPVAHHQKEEMTTEEVVDFLGHVKERRIQELAKRNEIKLKDKALLKAHLINHHQEELIDKLIKHLETSPSLNNIKQASAQEKEGKSHLVIYLSDMHIGAYVDDHAIYSNEYNKQEVGRRLGKVVDFVEQHKDEIYKITVFNLGDSIDGFNNTTMRGGHYLPQNMSNDEMVEAYFDLMFEFFSKLSSFDVLLEYICTRESNHGGNSELGATKILCKVLEANGVKTHISDSSIDCVKINNTNVVYLHGKDNKNMNRPFPNLLDAKTTAYFSQYCLENKLTSPILIVKGDQHRSAMTQTNMFEYKAVSSLFGSSDWIMSNFGRTPWGVDYSFFSDNNRMDGTIRE